MTLSIQDVLNFQEICFEDFRLEKTSKDTNMFLQLSWFFLDVAYTFKES